MGDTGSLTISTSAGSTTGGYWMNGLWYPDGYPYTSGTVQQYQWPISEPTSCIGKAHVFECEHVEQCKCGAITRVMPRPKKAK